ncbi:amidohydrolase family protein [Reichenbachiella agarivorans]|uniref:Amidohydrolase family protein n=1 Tax=Reichenbachiella agarivorans TaxID=2979464 RepID=A0ABY6CVH3_9BACT|nr:amidohydrolase family protein [Reichenbachiella agarivorans]UXP33929.1 amidohydrolase family protein [Reichenbachiella agarivorans]
MKTVYKISLAVCMMMVSLGIHAQLITPAPAQSSPIALVKGTAHLGNGEVIHEALITFVEGKIEKVMSYDAAPSLSGYDVIDVSGQHIYPGLILPNTDLGLTEVAAVRATNDNDEVGTINPSVRSLVAFNTESDLIPPVRFNGVLLAQVTPQGGLVSGTSSVVQLDAWNWEDAAYSIDDAVHFNWPSKMLKTGWWAEPGKPKANEKYDAQVQEIKKLLQDAKFDKAEKNLKLKAMKGVFDGTRSIHVHVDGAQEMMTAVLAMKQAGVAKIVIVGGEDAWLIKDFLKEHQIAVILSNVHRLPNRKHEDIDMPYKLAAMLQAEGVLVGLSYSDASNARNLPFFAGTNAAYGLNPETALKLVTSNTAEILGIADKTGMLKVGLDANIVVSEGDILDMRSNQISYAYIQGRLLEMKGKQQQLYEKYKAKYEVK